MTSVEKRHSGHRKHRKHSDGAHSDTSSGGGSFLDETDREVSSLTDRAFRSLCIGDEAVYNDSDLGGGGGGTSSPSVQREKQLAFSQSGHGWDPEALKRATHERFSLRVQQYGAERMQGGPHGAPQQTLQGDPQWEGYGERTERGVSATFQRSFVDMSQQEESQGDEQLSLLNGPMELGSQQRRSRSRVSSLIKAFSSEGCRDGNLREWNANEASWDKSALMSIQRELSEFSDACHQNFNSGPFSPPGPFSSRDNNFYSSEMATAVAHMDSSFTRTSHSMHSAFSSINSNFFMHSEFSPFKLWRDHNRFPFQQGEVTGFMPRSEFPRWYETPMYKELSLGPQPLGPGMYTERGARSQRKTLEPVAPPPPPRSTSTSSVLQKASALEKRCESELTGQYPPWKQTQGGQATNRLTSQRPSTVSPVGDLSRRVRDTLSSVSKLQQKITMMTSEEQSVTSLEVTAKQQGMLNSSDSLIPLSTVERNVAGSVASSMTPFNISQLLTPVIPPAYQDMETLDAMSPLYVEHPPVQAESRGATPDVRSSYKSRATSLLFNLKDNRKRVKSTYSTPEFKGPDLVDRGKQHVSQNANEPRDTIIDMPDFPDIQIPQVFVQEEPSMADAALQRALQEQCSRIPPPAAYTSQPMMEYSSLNKEYNAREYLVAQMQGETVPHGGGFSGFPQGNYNSNQLINGLNRQEDLSPFTPFKMGQLDTREPMQAGDVYGQASSEKLAVYNTLPIATSPLTKHNISPKPFYSTTDTARSNIDSSSQNRGYVAAKTGTEQNANASIFTNADGYEQVKENRYGYNAVSHQDSCRQQAYVSTTSSQEAESLQCVEDKPRPAWKGEISAYLSEKDKQAQSSQGAQEQSWNDGTSYNLHKAQLNAPYQPLASHNISNHFQQYAPLGNESVVLNDQSEPYSNQDPGTAKAKYERHRAQQNEGHEIKDNYPTHNYYPYGKMEQEYRKQQMLYSEDTKNTVMQETVPEKRHMSKLEENEALSIQQNDFKQQRDEHDEQRQLPSSAEGGLCDENVLTMTNQIRAENPKAEQIKADHTETEPPKTLQAGGVQVGQPSSGSSGAELNIEGQPGGERHKAGDMKAEQAMGALAQQLKAVDYNLEHAAEKQDEEEQASEGQTGHVQDKLANAAPDEMENKREQSNSDNREIQQLNSELAKAQQTQHSGVKQTEDRQADRELIVENTYEVKEIKQSEAEQVGISQVEQEELYGKIKIEHMEQAKEAKTRGELIDAGQLNTNTEQAQTEHVKAQLARAEQAKAELSKIEKMKSESAKSKAKQADTEQVKLEPTKVEHAKTELAKARAELAKIKEKMRGEQKDQVGRVSIEEGNVENKSTPEKFEMAENLMYQQNEDVIVNSSLPVKSDGGTDYFEHVREKYGWSNTDDSQKPPVDEVVGEINIEESKDETNPEGIPIDKIGQEQSLRSTEHDEVRENQYVYSESSKEFKLSSANDSLTDGNRINNDAFNDTAKDNQAMNDNSEKREHPVHNISLSRNSDPAKSLPPERKPNKDTHSTPYRALSYKERAQARQEILTSKIKAHAEKEISAIKEKGLSKNPTKHLVSGQAGHVRQKPPQLETSKGHDSTQISNIIAPKQHMGASEMRTVPLKSEDTAAVQPPTEHKQMESKDKAADEESRHKLTKVDQRGIESTTQSRTPAHFNIGEKESKHGENHEPQKEGFGSRVSNEDQSKVNKVDSSQAEALRKCFSLVVETLTTNSAEGESEEIPEDLGPSLKLVLGQSETTTADDDLQIMGIRVTVRERKPSLSDDQVYKDAHEGAKSTISPETQPLLFKQGIITRKAKDYTNKNPNESSVQTSVNEHKANFDKASKCEHMDLDGTSLPVEKRQDSAQSEENLYDENASIPGKENIHISMGKQDTRTHSGEHSQVEEQLHIDSIAIRVVPRVVESERQEITENHPAVKIPPSNVGVVNENKPAALPSPSTKTNTSKYEDRAKIGTPGSNELKPIKDSLEARHTSPSERQGTHSLRFGDEHNAAITTREDKQVKRGTPDKPVTVEATTHARMDEDYFQLQGATETNQTEVNLSSNVGNMSNAAVSQRNEEPGAKGSEEIASLHPESKASITKDHYLPWQPKPDNSFQVSGNRMAESTAESVHSRRMHSEVKDEQASKQSDGPTQRQSKFSARMKTDEDVHVRKHDTESQPNSSTTERRPSNSIHTTRDNTMQDNANYKQKPKEKTSVTPEISAIADYARLKVIAAEGSPDTMQDFHPGKKEGFFPLIQTRPSRRPVFTSEPQGLSAKERIFPKEPEVSAKVNKDPKSVVFSTMEQEHKRTGMFRLGDKENKLPDVKPSEGIAASTSASHPHPIQGQTHNLGLSGGAQREEETRIKKKEEEHTTQVAEERREKMRQERLAAQREEEIRDKRREAERKAEEERRAKQRQEELRIKRMMEERKAAEIEEAKKAAQREEERRAKERQAIAVRLEEERRAKQKEMDRKAEEERRAKQREVERKAEEERRAKQREMERKAEEERRAKQREMERKAEEERRSKQREVERKAEEERRTKQREVERKAEEERRAKQREMERRAEEERRAKQKEMERRAEEEKRAKQREMERRAEEEKREKERKAEEERREKQREVERKAEEERKAKEREAIAAKREQERREKLERREEEERRAKQAVEVMRRKQIEEDRRVAQREEERRAKEREVVAAKIEEGRRERQRQAERRAEEEKRAKEIEEQKIAKQRAEEERRAAQIEEERRIKRMEDERKAAQIEEERQERQRKEERRAAQLAEERKQMEEERKERERKEEMLTAQRAEEERRRRAAQIEEEERRERERKEAAQKQEEERRAVQLAEEIRIKQVEEERKAAQIEEEKKERQRRAAQREEDRRRAAQQEEEEKRSRLAAQQEEERRMAAQQEEERRMAAQQEEEERSRAALEEERKERQRKAAQREEDRRRAAQQEEEERSRAALEEERKERQRKAAQREEDRRRAAQQEEEKRSRLAAQQEEERRERQRMAALQEEEERSRAALEEERKERQRKAAQREEDRRRAAQQEEERKERQRMAALQEEEERSRAALEEERKERQRKAAQREEDRRRAAQQEEERRERHRKEERMVAQIQEERRRAAQIEEEESHAEEREEQQRATEVEEECQAMQEKERGAAQREEDRRDKQHAAQRTDVLQYYDINTAEGNGRPPRSPLPSRRRVEPPGTESAEDAGSYSRPHATPSPAPSASRSNASSPALGAKPTMFKVKDNTLRGASFTRSVKPRFHKNLGEDFRVGSPLDGWRGSQVAEDEQDKARHDAGTPIQHDGFPGSGRFSHIRDTSSTQDAPLLEHRPYNRRSIAFDEDDSRSIMSNMSEDMESFATSAADLAELRGIYDYDRPESACSFSSDVSRSLGKPPSVPVKSEKALRRAKRLTQRRIKKESKTSVKSPAREEKPLHTDSGVPSATNEELHSSDFPVLSSRHFSAPISLAHAPTQDSSSPSSSHSGSRDSRPSARSFHASPHHSPPVSLPIASPHHSPPVSLPIASPHHSPPVSLPIASPHHSPPVSLPIASPHHSPPVSLPAVPQKHAGHPVTQYHVEPGYSQNFPVTQRKVLQDPGSGHYYVVDMPVEVKAKTFFDPETGKYVQLNVRQTAQGGSPPQPRRKQQAQPQQPARPQAAPTGMPHALPQGYPGYPQHHQSSLPTHRSSSGMSATSTLPEDSGPARQRQNYGYQEDEQGLLDSHEQHNGSPEQTRYMDTACEPGKTRTAAHKTHNTEQATRGQPQINNTAAPNIITMSELEDFMDDW